MPSPPSTSPETPPGTVYLVGAGPGDPGLITARGEQLLNQADVVVYDGLVNPVLVDYGQAPVEKIYAGKKHYERGEPLTQAEIEAILIDRARRGLMVVRLKGGDPFLFGRGAEEAETLRAAGIPFEIVPGVSSATAVPAYAGIPLTHRDVASSVVFVATGQGADNGPASVDWNAAARADTIVLFMAIKTLPDIAARLIAAGRDPQTPAAAIRWGTTPKQETIVGTLADLAARVDAAGMKPPALVVVGEVVKYRERLAWYDNRPLFGLAILSPTQLVPDDTVGGLSALEDLGATVHRYELTERQVFDVGISLASDYRWIAFTSHASARIALNALLLSGLDMRSLAGIRIAAIGDTTAHVLRTRGIRADLVPDEKTSAGLAKAMLAADPDLPGSKVLFPRAEGGREELPDTLRAAGVEVTVVPLYRTVPVSPERLAPLVTRLRAGDLDVLTFFAPSQVNALAEALGEDAPAVLARARAVAAIGPTTAAALRARGIRVDIVAAEPSAKALVESILAHFASSPIKENR